MKWYAGVAGRGTWNWKEALPRTNTLNPANCDLTDGSSKGDWRLPNVRELQSLID
jgi:hypothetical protein